MQPPAKPPFTGMATSRVLLQGLVVVVVAVVVSLTVMGTEADARASSALPVDADEHAAGHPGNVRSRSNWWAAVAPDYSGEVCVCYDQRSGDCLQCFKCRDGQCVCKIVSRGDCNPYDFGPCSDDSTVGKCTMKPSLFDFAAPYFIAAFAGFVCLGSFLFVCKLLTGYGFTNGPQAGDGDTESVSSMQRWINERLRNRPPRYEEMDAASAPTPAPTPASTLSASADPVILLAAEKPPSYEIAMAESQTSSVYQQPPAEDGDDPPAYSALAASLTEEGRGFSNPCFLDDDGPPALSALPPTPSSPSSLTSISTLSSSSASSISSSSASSVYLSLSSDTDREGLLTVSQVVAIQEMILAESSTASARAQVQH